MCDRKDIKYTDFMLNLSPNNGKCNIIGKFYTENISPFLTPYGDGQGCPRPVWGLNTPKSL